MNIVDITIKLKSSLLFITGVLFFPLYSCLLPAFAENSKEEIPNLLIERKNNSVNFSLLISASSVQNRLASKRSNIILVDVRSTESFNKIRIAGSINIPLYAIKTKTFLKTKTLVLVNEGYGYSKLMDECNRLKNSGFTSVSILNGGLNSWIRENGHLEGNHFDQENINRISPRSFFEDKDYKDIIVVEITKDQKSQVPSLIPRSLSVPFSENISKLTEEVKSKVSSAGKDKPLYVLVVCDGEEVYEKLEKYIRSQITWTVFYLEGGKFAYNEFLKDQALMWKPEKTVMTGKPCLTCD